MGLFGEFIDVSKEQEAVEAKLDEIEKQVRNLQRQQVLTNQCDKCSEVRKCVHKENSAMALGLGHKKILIIQGSPDRSVIATGDYTSGRTYEYLDQELSRMGLDLERDCWITYAFRTPTKETITDGKIAACRPKLMSTIKHLQPEKIILLGKLPMKGILGHRASTRVKLGDMTRWSGWEIPDQELGAMVYPMYDPFIVQMMDNYLLEKENTKILRKAIKSPRRYSKYNYPTECSYIDNEAEAIRWLEECKKYRKIAFDYETTGIKPHREGQRIICLAVSNGLFSCGFRMYNSRAFRYALYALLTDPKIEIIAHNRKFEDEWTQVFLGYAANNWGNDPMLAAHVIDNRAGITSLKTQDYINFGHMGYDRELDPYMEAVKPGNSIYDSKDSNNSFNMLEYAPIDKLCMYCAEDSHSTFKLSEVQKLDVDRHRRRGLDLLMWSTTAYVRMETAGVHVNMQELDFAEIKVDTFIQDSNRAIQTDPDVLLWRQKSGRDFDHGSPADLKDFIYDFMGETPFKKTGTGNPSTDKEVLEALAKAGSCKVYSAILVHRKWTKVKQYIDGIRREVVDGIIHCFFNLGSVRSYRTSSNSINLQNIPKRDEAVTKLLRAVFVPTPGHMFIEADFKAFEVTIYAAYCGDEMLLSYVKDLNKDMHRDMGAYIMKLTWAQMQEIFGKKGAKKFRQETKSGFVFSQLYGAGAETCAQYFWDFFQTDEGQVYWESFRDRTGIETFSEWLAWIEQVEDYFWNGLFPKLGEWKEANWKKYTESGKIKYFTGFYATGVMAKTQATNFPVQGTASNIKLAVLSMLSDKLAKDGAKTKIFAEIHDSIVMDAHPDELEYIYSSLRWIVDVKIPEMYPRLQGIPLYLERSEGVVDGSWATVVEGDVINA